MVISSIAWDIINKTIVKPSQEIHKEIVTHACASKNKLTKNPDRRTNQDTSAGLYVCSAVQEKDRIIKQPSKYCAGKFSTREETLRNNVEKKKQQEELLFVMVQGIQRKGSDIIDKTSAKNLKQIFLYLGGVLNTLPDKKKQTVIAALKNLG